MKHLFIIGNGFDKHLELPTGYDTFRNYILSLYPDAEEYDEVVPESTLMPDGDEVMDMDEVAGFLISIIDACGGKEWNELE